MVLVLVVTRGAKHTHNHHITSNKIDEGDSVGWGHDDNTIVVTSHCGVRVEEDWPPPPSSTWHELSVLFYSRSTSVGTVGGGQGQKWATRK